MKQLITPLWTCWLPNNETTNYSVKEQINIGSSLSLEILEIVAIYRVIKIDMWRDTLNDIVLNTLCLRNRLESFGRGTSHHKATQPWLISLIQHHLVPRMARPDLMLSSISLSTSSLNPTSALFPFGHVLGSIYLSPFHPHKFMSICQCEKLVFKMCYFWLFTEYYIL